MANTIIIIPCYNEAENIISLIETIFSTVPDAHILVVDDSSDATSSLIREKQKGEPRLFLIQRAGKGGRGSAVLEGFGFALDHGYQRIVEMDADFSHDPQELPTLLAASRGNTVVIGSRYLPESRIINWPLSRRIFSRCANFYANVVLRIGLHDYTNGYRVYDRSSLILLERSKIGEQGYIVLSEIAYQLFRKGVSFLEIPSRFVNRKRGTSNFSFREVSDAFLSVLRIRASR